MKIICPVAFDLGYDQDGRVTIGKVTRNVCDLAIAVAEKDPKNSVVFTPAGCASTEWDHVYMGIMMSGYVSRRTTAHISTQVAPEFTTFGELMLVAHFASQRKYLGEDITDVNIAAISWHAPLAAYICRRLMDKQGLRDMPIYLHTHGLSANWSTLAREYLLSWPKNFLRLCLTRSWPY